MGRYMNVVLKKKYKNDLFIASINEELINKFGANTWTKFNPYYFLQEEADYINNHPDGKKQLEGWKRPIEPETLSCNFFWLQNGLFSIKLSGGTTSEEGKDAVAVCKWIIATKKRYIDTAQSHDYCKRIVSQYLNNVFEQDGYDLEKLWEI